MILSLDDENKTVKIKDSNDNKLKPVSKVTKYTNDKIYFSIRDNSKLDRNISAKINRKTGQINTKTIMFISTKNEAWEGGGICK